MIGMAKRELFGIVVLIAVLFVFFGCTAQSDDKSLAQFSALQAKYSVSENFSTSQATMNTYISALAELRGKSSGSPAKIIDAELYSAQAFYYFNKALAEQTAVSYPDVVCSLIEVKSLMSDASLASNYADKAVIAISGLSDLEKSKLRANQLDMMKNYQTQINQTKNFYEGKC
ncbi:Uncharacterised protein [uncultured archaeon]|nr:Uncharacterised protein [uncultured archaeon]